jgi:CRISPR-associated protein Cas8a1/Csx13
MGDAEESLTWRFIDDGMGLLERVGLAALYMTLRAADEHRKKLLPLRWDESDLTTDSVTVRWTGPAKPAFVKLFEFAWQVRDGVLYLPAIHRTAKPRDNPHLRVSMHNGITRTFLQHPRVQPKGAVVKRIVQLDEHREIEIAYQPLESTKLKPVADLKTAGFFTREQDICGTPVSLSSWAFPGIAGRYHGEGAWSGSANFGLLLMLSPIACLYQQLHSERGTWLFVVPDVFNLAEFDERRQLLKLDPAYTDVASPGDAGMQFLAEFGTSAARRELQAGCQVVAMGRVKYYNEGQSIRKGVVNISPTPVSLKRYRILHRELV